MGVNVLTVDKLTPQGQRLADLFKKYPETKDSYSALVVRYWAEYCDGFALLKFVSANDVIKLPSPEYITRMARKVQNDLKMFRPTQDAQKKRQASILDFSGMRALK